MKLLNIVSVAAAAAAAIAPVAATAGETVGHVSSADAGAMILRDGKVVPAKANMAVQTGDRLITRSNGRAKLAMNNGCSTSVGANSAYAVSANCSGAPVSMTKRAGAKLTEANAASSGTYVVAALGLAAVGLGIWAAADSDSDTGDGNPTPVSP